MQGGPHWAKEGGGRVVESRYLGASQLGSGGDSAAGMRGTLLGWLAVLTPSCGSWQSGSAPLGLIQLSPACSKPSPSAEATLQQKHSINLSGCLPFLNSFTRKRAVVR